MCLFRNILFMAVCQQTMQVYAFSPSTSSSASLRPSFNHTVHNWNKTNVYPWLVKIYIFGIWSPGKNKLYLVIVAEEQIAVCKCQSHIHSIVTVHVENSPQQFVSMLRGSHVFHYIIPPDQTLLCVLVGTFNNLVCRLREGLSYFVVVLL